MTLTGTDFVQTIADHGIPGPWQRLGWVLAYDGAISTHLVRAVQEAYRIDSADARDAVHRLFDEKLDNLAEARGFIAIKLAEYDRDGRWQRLDNVIRAADIDQVIEDLRPHFGLHPFPIVLESVRFNFNYVREHGFRAFYTMTEEYLSGLVAATEQGRLSFDANEDAEAFPPFWLFKLDLNSIEVPVHCDVCRVVITYAERALDAG